MGCIRSSPRLRKWGGSTPVIPPELFRSVYNSGVNRRKFLVLGGGSLLVSVARLKADHHFISADPLIVEFDLRSLEGEYTPVGDFYIRNHFNAPPPSAVTALQIEGEVDNPKEFALNTLTAFSRQRQGAVLECAGDRVGTSLLASNGLWEGWRLRDVLTAAHPRPGAGYVHLYGADGFARSVPLNRALASGLLVTNLNGRPLQKNHGAPWRALFVGWYGMDSVKWLQRIVVAREPLPPNGVAYLELRKGPSGLLQEQPLPRMEVKSVIISLAEGSVLQAGPLEVRGLAWTGAGKVKAVEASADGGATWHPAALQPTPAYEWAPWRARFNLTQRGAVEFASRATDQAGAIQPAKPEPGRLDGYAYNYIQQVRCVVL